jgi:alpha/beta superfamily hydrolase
MTPRTFERPAVIALSGDEGAQGLALEGLFVPSGEDGGHGAVIAPPHPQYGGSMDSPVVTEIAQACASTETASLRFNWRGVGGSGGHMSGEGDVALADYCAALAFLEETVTGPLVACGYSFGAATAVRAAASSTRVQRLLLVAPPPAMLAPGALATFGGRLLVVVGDRDEFAPVDQLEQALAGCDAASLRFEVLPATDHFFMSSLGEVGRLTADWLSRR